MSEQFEPKEGVDALKARIDKGVRVHVTKDEFVSAGEKWGPPNSTLILDEGETL